ncbi:hypothetical protein FRB94_004413 [Tulasnella sp. JGI-2019a]|nr:hypothetical protein FRB94_004413 [Tulasnella sp. JGI-2019a]KAG9036199.1 hypothetical protein FRB95_009562 [Tulasnella sp. JGI-2019a]
MAGDHGALKPDPALERWNLMREDVYKHFKFTPSVTRKVILWAAIVPVTAWAIASQQDYKWDWAGKGKTESLYRTPRTPAPAGEESK